ncbi:unnamed protein product [Cladocopium goreaui]|uniref:Uncharacterized protein n=1 Tax=Cladocopium goreaui TaxID=2562237 RepID=A0A9P1CDG6_9DINO|nr:unnamed protein product [Cladocopium goreaui]
MPDTKSIGQTALHWAAREGQAAVVEQLISAGATVDAADEDGRGPGQLKRRAMSALERLAALSANVVEFARTVLHVAAENGQAAVVEQLISAGATVDAATERETPLHFAAVKGHAAVVEQLISAGATIGRGPGRVFGSFCETVLHVAAENGQAAVVEQLISAGATVDAATERETPLHFAAVKGHAAVVEQLISAGATVDAADGIGRGPGRVFGSFCERHALRLGQGAGPPPGDGPPSPSLLAAVLVFVALLSGRSCRCNSSPERTVLELKEEAERLGTEMNSEMTGSHRALVLAKKLGVNIKRIIGQNHEPLPLGLHRTPEARSCKEGTERSPSKTGPDRAAHPTLGSTAPVDVAEPGFGHRDESKTLAAAAVVPGNTLTAVIAVPWLNAKVTQASEAENEEGPAETEGPQLEASFEVLVLSRPKAYSAADPMPEVLPAGHVPLGRLLRLTPEDRPFPTPVKGRALGPWGPSDLQDWVEVDTRKLNSEFRSMTSSSAYPAQAEAAVAIDPEVPMFGVWRLGRIGKDVHQAAKEDNVGAVRHFLRVDPDSLERKDIHFGRSLGTEVGSYEADPRNSSTTMQLKNKGGTPLHVAAARGHVEVVALLLRSGASVEVENRLGRCPRGATALRVTASNGHAAVVEQLISAGAKVDAASNSGRGPGRVFGSFGEWLWRGDGRGEYTGETALHFAARDGHAAVVEQLISAGATVDAANKYRRGPGGFRVALGVAGQTPYDLAEGNGHRQVFVALLSGRSCRCDPWEKRTVLELKEETEKKLGITIKHIIGENHEPLDESMELAAAHIVPGNTLTAMISEDVLEEGHPEAQDGVEIKDFPHGIRLMAQQAIFEAFDPQIEVLENWNDLKDVSALEEALPAGHVPLARLLRLTPEDRTFPAPVKVQVPTCAGAETLWRSSTAGWEQVETATFEETRATVTVDHFCEFVVTGKPHPLKGLGFLHAQGENAQVIIMHTGCESCERSLEVLCSDPDSLQPLRRCSPNLQLGTFRNDEALEIKQPGRTSKMKIRFHRMPLVSPELDAQSRQHFDVEIEDKNHCFKIRPEEATAATAATASRSVGPHAASSAQASSAASTDMRSAAASQQGHLLLSGRFNSNEIIEYMKAVKKQLEARNVPVFMVEATVGQSFADLTRIGLGRAKGMVTFCTSEYGAYTGVGYETFHELEFAHDHRLPLFPIRLCEQWPPAPQNNERGIYQNQLVFKNGLVYIDDRQMNKAQRVADQIAESVARMGIFETKLQL